MNRVFVYGTLKSGFGNNVLLSQGGANFLGTAELQPGMYKMYSLGGFPGLVKDEAGPPIHGEVWECDNDTLRDLDRLEGYPGWYERHTITTTFGDAYVYAMPEARPSWPEVTTGIWTGRRSSI